jgi:two-component system, sensor histidine kinase and response regulator
MPTRTPSDPLGRAAVKCLVVDDIEDNLLALSALLQADDVQVLTASSGAEALELLLLHDVALALLDVNMPGMDGFELAELMRGNERTRHVPLIFVTAGARDQYRTFKGYDAGAVDFLYKPVEPHVLQSKADIFFQLHRQKQRLAQELRERTDTLRLNEMLTAVLGHDLRDPLNAIMVSAHLMRSQSDSEAVLSAAERILSSGHRMTQMIQDILDLARARLSGGIPLSLEPTDLAAVVEHVVAEQRAATREVPIEVHLMGDLRCAADPDRLAQVVSNLLRNAVTYGLKSEPIHLELDGRSPDAVRGTVINAGTIPPEVRPYLFDPFRAGERRGGRGRTGGLGLGLYIVEQIVTGHGGRIEVQSSAQHTRFEFTLPRGTPSP